METAVLVGGGCGVNVAVGGTLIGPGSLVRVGDGINGVLDAVGEDVTVLVADGLAVYVGVAVGVATNLANASAVKAAAVFALEKARPAISPGSMTMGSATVGSDNAIADVPQNRLNPSALAANIHKSPA